MKRLFKVALTAGFLFMATSFANAQTKIGHINFNQLVDLMPEAKTVNTQITAYNKSFADQLQTMYTELQTKGQTYEKGRAAMTDAVRTAKEAELQDMQKRMQDFQNTAQQQVEAKKNELGKPIIDKARAAIATVAKEKGYAYVLDSSQVDLIVSPAGDDLLDAVKVKLALK
jgi:outer membrane protein